MVAFVGMTAIYHKGCVMAHSVRCMEHRRCWRSGPAGLEVGGKTKKSVVRGQLSVAENVLATDCRLELSIGMLVDGAHPT